MEDTEPGAWTTRMKKFSDIPWHSVSFEPQNGWGWGRGGSGLDDDTYTINFTHNDLSQDVYPLPKALSYMLSQQLKHGASEAIARIHAALHI